MDPSMRWNTGKLAVCQRGKDRVLPLAGQRESADPGGHNGRVLRQPREQQSGRLLPRIRQAAACIDSVMYRQPFGQKSAKLAGF